MKCENPYEFLEDDESCLDVGFGYGEMCYPCRNEHLENLTDTLVDIEKDKKLRK